MEDRNATRKCARLKGMWGRRIAQAVSRQTEIIVEMIKNKKYEVFKLLLIEVIKYWSGDILG